MVDGLTIFKRNEEKIMKNFSLKKIIYSLIGISVIFTAIVCAMLKIYLTSYQVFTARTKVATIRCLKPWGGNSSLDITFHTGDLTDTKEVYPFGAEELVVEARIVKWANLLGLLGIQNYYRLERVSGRYFKIEDEKEKQRFVYGIYKNQDILWWLIYKYQKFIPGIDAVYGNSVFVPFEDGKIFEVYITRTGLMINDISIPQKRYRLSTG